MSLNDEKISAAHLPNCLSAIEFERAQLFKQDEQKQRYILVRSALRKILAAYLNIDPLTVEFSCNEYGKPELAKNSSNIYFNLSHSGDLAAFAISNAPVGIDIEKQRILKNPIDLAKRFFSSAECALLEKKQNSDEQLALFFRLWTAKEAMLKGLGVGIANHLAKAVFDINKQEALSLTLLNGSAAEAQEWQFKELKLAATYFGALALNSASDFSVQMNNFSF